MKKYINWYLILLMVLSSGTVYFTYKFKSITYTSLFILSLILLFNKKFNIFNIKVMLLWMIIITSNVFFHPENNVSFSSILSLYFALTSVALISMNINLKEYKKMYVLILSSISIISLITFYLGIYIPKFQEVLRNYFVINGNEFYACFWHTWGTNFIFDRNAGPFWEPGAYQAFINLALMFLIDLKIKNKKILFIILSVTLLSTKSATGYIIYFVILLILIFRASKEKLIKKNFILPYILCIGILITGIGILNTDSVKSKLSGDHVSTEIRSNDVKNSIKLILEKPISGYGLYTNEQIKYGIVNNSAALLNFGYSFGLIILILYIIYIYIGIKRCFGKVGNLFFFLIILMMMTEDVLFFPIFLMFLFKWKDEEKLYL